MTDAAIQLRAVIAVVIGALVIAFAAHVLARLNDILTTLESMK